MVTLVNRAKVATATTGTGTITLGPAESGYQTFADAGVSDADVVRYTIEDGDAWEIGLGTYSAGTLTRGSIESSNSDLALNLTGNAVVFVSAAAADLQELVDFADNFVLPTADGSTGQVLTTNGAGTLSFTTVTGYTDADVDAHLNTGTAASGEVLSWNGTDYDWVAVSGGATDINGLSDGYYAGYSLGLGAGALDNFSGSNFFNTAVGYNAGRNLTTGIYNVAVGAQALEGRGPAAHTGQNNVGVGYQAGSYITTGRSNNFIGTGAGNYATTPYYTIGIGHDAFRGGTSTPLTGWGNVGLGYQTGYDLSSGAYNFLGGYRAGTNLTTGSNNVALGNGALDAATTGSRNIAIGQDAMGLGVATASTGDNVAIGYQAGYDLTSGADNVMIGDSAGANVTTALNTVFIGQQAGFSATSDSLSVGIGYRSLYNLTGGGTSTAPLVAIGREAMLSATGTNYDSVAVGSQALKNMTSGYQNTGIGGFAGGTITTGIQNTVIGKGFGGAGALTTGSNNTLLGNVAAPSSATVSNEITLGNSSITRFRVPGAGIDNTSAALSGTTPSVDVGARDTYTLTTSGNTTFTFTGAPSSGQVGTFSLIITAGGTHTLTWPASVDWAGGTAPDAPASGEKDIYTFMTVDGGTTWYGFLAGDAMA